MGRKIIAVAAREYLDDLAIDVQVDQGDSLEPLLECPVVIDFSTPVAMMSLVRSALQTRGRLPAFVIGSTGWTPAQKKALDRLAQRTAVFVASNYSIAIAVLAQTLQSITPILVKLGYKPSMLEIHHLHKVDSPSGTALDLRSTADPRATDKSFPIESKRVGEVIGEHQIAFTGRYDALFLHHSAQDRALFAQGALEVALWLTRRKQIRKGKILTPENFAKDLMIGLRKDKSPR